jgi:hypothetical protein
MGLLREERSQGRRNIGPRKPRKVTKEAKAGGFFDDALPTDSGKEHRLRI